MGIGSRTKAADANRPQDYKDRTSWKPRPWLGRSIRLALALVPIAAAFAVTLVLGRILYQPSWSLMIRILWGFAMFIVGSVVGTAVGQWASRLVPLSSLCQMNLAFPEEAPSRLKMALRVGNSGNTQAVLDDFRNGRLATDPQLAAEQVLTLVEILNNHDRRTRGHSERVRALSDVIAEEMCLPEKDRSLLRWASLLHDIGKLSVPSEILNKKGKPTEEEWKILQGHPAAGHSRIAPLAGWLGEWALCIEQHHERFDGTGYPLRLTGEQMPIGSRIVAVADAFEVMTASRSYKKPMSYDDARAELARCAGTHFDPKVVRAFLNVGYKDSRLSKGFLSSITGELASGNGAIAKVVARVVENGITGSPSALLGASAAKAGVFAAALSVASAGGVPIVSFDNAVDATVLADQAATVESTTVPSTLPPPSQTTVVVSGTKPAALALIDETVPSADSAPTSVPAQSTVVSSPSPTVTVISTVPSNIASTTIGLFADVNAPIASTVRAVATNPPDGVTGQPGATAATTRSVATIAPTITPTIAPTTRLVTTTRFPTTTRATTSSPPTRPVTSSTTSEPTTTEVVTAVPTTQAAPVTPAPVATVPPPVATVPPTSRPATTTSTSTIPLSTTTTTTLPTTTTATTATLPASTTATTATLPASTTTTATTLPTTTSTTTLPTTTSTTTTTTSLPTTTSTTTTTTSLPTTTSTTTTTMTVPVPAGCALWTVEYFSNSGLVGPPTPDQGGCLASVNGYWGSASPSVLITGDAFSARYKRQMPAGAYTLTVRADDGFRVRVNGTVIADHWGPSGTIGSPLAVPMTLGASSTVALEYQELGGWAVFDVDISGGIPFLTTNAAIAATSGLGALGSWTIDVFGAPGNPPSTGNPANSMNVGLIKPRAMTATGNFIYVADATGRLHLLNLDGSYLSATPIPEGVVSIAKLPLTFVGLALPCSVGWVGTITGTVSMSPSVCGTGVVPGTYLAAAMVFEGSVHEIAVEGNNVYVLDDKYVWKTTGAFASFTAVIGTEAASGTVPDGTDGLSYGLSNPESIAARNGILIVGEAARVLRFDPTGLDTFAGSLLIGASAIAGDPLTTLQAYDTTVSNVSAVQFLDDNTLLFAEQYRDLVRVVDLVALTVAPVAGKEWVAEGPYFDASNTPIPSMNGRLFDPVDIVVGNNAVYVLQDGYSLIHRFN